MYLFSGMFIEVYQVKRLVETSHSGVWTCHLLVTIPPPWPQTLVCPFGKMRTQEVHCHLNTQLHIHMHIHTLCSDITLLRVSDWFNRHSNSTRMRCHDIRSLSCKICSWLRRITQILWPPGKRQPHGKLNELFVLFICSCVILRKLWNLGSFCLLKLFSENYLTYLIYHSVTIMNDKKKMTDKHESFFNPISW